MLLWDLFLKQIKTKPFASSSGLSLYLEQRQANKDWRFQTKKKGLAETSCNFSFRALAVTSTTHAFPSSLSPPVSVCVFPFFKAWLALLPMPSIKAHMDLCPWKIPQIIHPDFAFIIVTAAVLIAVLWSALKHAVIWQGLRAAAQLKLHHMQWDYVCCTCSKVNAGARGEGHYNFLVNLCLMAKIGPFFQSLAASDFLHSLQKDLQLGPQVNSIAVRTLLFSITPVLRSFQFFSAVTWFCFVLTMLFLLCVIMPLIFVPWSWKKI